MIEKSTSCLFYSNFTITITAIDRIVTIFYHRFCHAYLTKNFGNPWKERPLGFGGRHQCMSLPFERRSFRNASTIVCIVSNFMVLLNWPCTWSKPHSCTLHVSLNCRNRSFSRKNYHGRPIKCKRLFHWLNETITQPYLVFPFFWTNMYKIGF